VPEERCAILLEEDVPVDPRKYGDLVAPSLGLTKVEARMAVRRGRGILLENLAAEDARRIADELARDGIAARVVPRERLTALPPPRKVDRLERGEDLLRCRGMALPWEAILVASCGVVARPECGDYFEQVRFGDVPPLHRLEDRDREIVRENLILKMAAASGGPGKAKPGSVFEDIDLKHSARVRVYFDLLTADLGTWLRASMEEMGYVASPDGVAFGGSWGFQALADDLRKLCAPALTEIALKLLDGADIRELVFPRIEEFTRYTAWVALKRHLWTDAASSSPSPEPPGPPTGGGSSNASPGPEPPSTSS